MRKVYGLIRPLGATSKYKGYYFVAEAVKLSMGFAEKPVRITIRSEERRVGKECSEPC